MSNGDYISQCLESGYHHGTKTADCFGEINEAKKVEMLRKLHIADEKSGAVTIPFSTEGGDVGAGFAIYNAIRAMKNEVRIIGVENIESIGTLILQAADESKRLLMPDCYLMLHEGSATIDGSKKDRKQQEDLNAYYEKRYYDILHAKVKEVKRISRKRFIDKVEECDWILTAEEALSWGLADAIVETY